MYYIESLKFLDCLFSIMDLTSFNNIQDTVTTLSFVNLQLKAVSLRIFTYFPKLKWLTFRNTTVANYDVNYLEMIRRSLEYLEIHPLIDDTNLDIFRLGVFERLRHIQIHSKIKSFKVIQASNFSDTPYVKTLDLSYCHLEAILKGTFDHLSLVALRLEGNHLNTIQLEDLQKTIIRMLQRMGTINLNSNQFTCDCDFFLIRNISYWKLKDMSQSVFEPELKCQADENVTSAYCDGVQEIRPKAICATRMAAKLYTLPKYNIKINLTSNSYVIKSSRHQFYRVWIQNVINFSEFNLKWGYEEVKCPRKGYIMSDTLCIQLRNETEAIPIEDYLPHSKFKILCVSYVNGGSYKFWPLHCITHRNFEYDLEIDPIYAYIIYGCTSFIGVLFAVLITAFGRNHILRWIPVYTSR